MPFSQRSRFIEFHTNNFYDFESMLDKKYMIKNLTSRRSTGDCARFTLFLAASKSTLLIAKARFSF